MPSESLHLAVHVDRPVAVVYAFASDPRRLQHPRATPRPSMAA